MTIAAITNDAPLETPRSSGPASGLRIESWKSVPARANIPGERAQNFAGEPQFGHYDTRQPTAPALRYYEQIR